ncbi:MAG TPA: YihY/virulence factor BrkB family protein, partial [Actinomycetota bacterium]|nr:YihY/virulence factor BrkB family protein [Actinomycetota bacterium]
HAAFNRVYGVPRNERPNPVTSRLRSLLLLLLLGIGVLITTGLSALTTSAGIFGPGIAAWVRGIASILSFGANVGLFLAAFHVLVARRLRFREVAIGGLIAGGAWQLLQTLGIYYLAHHLKYASDVYGVFGFVLGLLAWIYLEAAALVFSAEINVVLHRRLWPRALATPFTDDVDLTGPDKRAYASYAASERYKGFQRVGVSFLRRRRRRRSG